MLFIIIFNCRTSAVAITINCLINGREGHRGRGWVGSRVLPVSISKFTMMSYSSFNAYSAATSLGVY